MATKAKMTEKDSEGRYKGESLREFRERQTLVPRKPKKEKEEKKTTKPKASKAPTSSKRPPMRETVAASGPTRRPMRGQNAKDSKGAASGPPRRRANVDIRPRANNASTPPVREISGIGADMPVQQEASLRDKLSLGYWANQIKNSVAEKRKKAKEAMKDK